MAFVLVQCKALLYLTLSQGKLLTLNMLLKTMELGNKM